MGAAQNRLYDLHGVHWFCGFCRPPLQTGPTGKLRRESRHCQHAVELHRIGGRRTLLWRLPPAVENRRDARTTYWVFSLKQPDNQSLDRSKRVVPSRPVDPLFPNRGVVVAFA